MKSYPLPSGTVEYSPEIYQRLNTLKQIIGTVYQKFGYQPLETSILQYLDTLSSEGDITKEIYAINRAKSEGDTHEANRGLRFDLTKPLARYIAENQGQLTFPFRRSEIGLVFRGERPQKGRFRQLYQADFDIIARDQVLPNYDAEILQIVWSVFNTLNIAPFVIRVNNRRLMQALLESYGVQESQFATTLQTIDKLDKIGSQAVRETLISNQIAPEIAKKIAELIQIKSSLQDISQLTFKLPKEANIQAALEETLAVFGNLPKTMYSNFVLDLSITRGLDYYTGTVFETNLIGYEKYGSVCSGGRYDNLVGNMSKLHFPGVGGSVGLSRLFSIIQLEKLKFDYGVENELVYFAIADSTRVSATQEIALDLRNKGKTIIVSSGGKLGKQFEQANKMGAKFVYILEENGLISVKDMKTGEVSQLSV